MRRHLAAAVVAAALAASTGGCGSQEDDGYELGEVYLLGPDTPVGSRAQLAERELCVNASDLRYLLMAFTQEAPVDGDLDQPRIAEVAAMRALHTVEAIDQQLPAEDVGSAATPAVIFWRTFVEMGSGVGFSPDDPESFNAQFDQRVEAYQPATARLSADLHERCREGSPDYGTGLSPVAPS